MAVLEERHAKLTQHLLRRPRDPDALLARAKVRIALDRPGAAGRDLFLALSERHLLAATIAAEHPEYERHPFLVELLAKDSALGAAAIALADERVADALAELELAELLDRSDATAEFFASTALMELGRVDESLVRARTAASLWPRFADAHFNVATASEDPDEAETAYRRVLSIEPDHEGANHNLLLSLEARGRIEEARELGAGLIGVAPGAFLARYRYAELLVRTGAIDEARSELADLLPLSEGARCAFEDDAVFAPLFVRPEWRALLE